VAREKINLNFEYERGRWLYFGALAPPDVIAEESKNKFEKDGKAFRLTASLVNARKVIWSNPG